MLKNILFLVIGLFIFQVKAAEVNEAKYKNLLDRLTMTSTFKNRLTLKKTLSLAIILLLSHKVYSSITSPLNDNQNALSDGHIEVDISSDAEEFLYNQRRSVELDYISKSRLPRRPTVEKYTDEAELAFRLSKLGSLLKEYKRKQGLIPEEYDFSQFKLDNELEIK